ncbi:F-box only protein 15-like isoform X2 [Parambassis ranga]|uniref:F-box only protein 15-like isoform X2 n=1 Tax=Parambassis ranga TaxID=210632 RepID=A0A6P7HUF8_9TELE|nr:F-box only protein 15-like isoform X2 [Parambassis ranga]
MAAGGQDFSYSFLQVLKKKSDQPAPGRAPQLYGPRRGRQAGGGGEKRQPKRGQSPVQARRLPPEILIKILMFLDPSSLICISHVSRLLNRLANENIIWYRIYVSEFGGQTWKPAFGREASAKDSVEVEDGPALHWKNEYFRTTAGQEINKWRRELGDVSPCSGLPMQTERILRSLNITWELTVYDRWGYRTSVEPSQAHFFKSSVIIRWSSDSFPLYDDFSSILLHGIQKKRGLRTRKHSWSSLILKVNTLMRPHQLMGKDRLMTMMHLSPGIIIGVWRGHSQVAFIMISLHFHKLVEKSLLGTPVCPYSEPPHLPPADDSDPKYGLHGFSLHFILHNTCNVMLSGQFCQLSCGRDQFRHGLVELKVINQTNLSKHRLLSGSIGLPWRSEGLEGSVENCCIMTLTLLDEFKKPFWCVCSPVLNRLARSPHSVDYGGDHFEMEHFESDGQVKMKLVMLKEPQQFLLISLIVCVSVSKVNKHFSREYGS